MSFFISSLSSYFSPLVFKDTNYIFGYLFTLYNFIFYRSAEPRPKCETNLLTVYLLVVKSIFKSTQLFFLSGETQRGKIDQIQAQKD